MEASAEMKWGLICSVDDQENMKDYIDFSIWMVKQLEISASKLQLGHKFVEMPTFVLHAIPGSIDQSRECYETIAKQHPQVIYVIHILPSKDSLEYQVLKEHTLAGALVGQGVLADNALAYFKCYELDEVMANMNQWIGRRLAQITARRTKDNYRLTVATGANATNLFGGEMTTNFDRRSPSFNTNNDFEHSVDVVLHSSSLHSNLGAPQQTNNNRSFNSREKNTSCNEIGIEREKEVLVKGYPPNFNKFQIASLFSDFRPLNVQYMESGESIVQFVNKFHAVQVIEKYNGRKYEDEGFTLQVRSAAKEDPTKQIGAVKTKLASLLLMITTAKAVGKENVTTTSEEDKEGW